MDLPPMEPGAFSTLTITSHLCGSNSFSYLLTYRICETAFVTSSVDLADSIIVLNSVSYVEFGNLPGGTANVGVLYKLG